MGSRTVLEAGAGALAEYYEWQQDAAHGDVLVYWIGDLQYDRQEQVDGDDPDANRKLLRVMAANSLANRIMADQKAGQVALVQKRIGIGVAEYWAVRVRGPGGGIGCETMVRPNADLVLV